MKPPRRLRHRTSMPVSRATDPAGPRCRGSGDRRVPAGHRRERADRRADATDIPRQQIAIGMLNVVQCSDLMKFMLLMLPTVPGTLEDRKRLRPIGRNNERYQQMLEELRKLVAFADEVGFDCFATTEHHFHSAGYETSVAPLLLYADLAARTMRIKFARLGLVVPAGDPSGAAEELAVVDHLDEERLYAVGASG